VSCSLGMVSCMSRKTAMVVCEGKWGENTEGSTYPWWWTAEAVCGFAIMTVSIVSLCLVLVGAKL